MRKPSSTNCLALLETGLRYTTCFGSHTILYPKASVDMMTNMMMQQPHSKKNHSCALNLTNGMNSLQPLLGTRSVCSMHGGSPTIVISRRPAEQPFPTIHGSVQAHGIYMDLHISNKEINQITRTR